VASNFDELITPLTTTQIRQAIYDGLAAQGTDTTLWKPGAVVRTLIACVAVVLAALSTMISLVARMGFLELSSGAWLTLVAKYVYGVTRFEATFATGAVTLTNTGGGVYSLGIGDVVLSNPTTGKTYVSTEALNLAAHGTATIAVQATEAGSASTSAAGAVTTIETGSLMGVACANAIAIVGLDEELDAALISRCRDKTAAVSPNGPADAYSFFARSALRADGTSIGVTRVRTVPGTDGSLNVYVATATGAVTGDEDDPSTDLGRIAADIWEYAEPQCVTAHAVSATPVAIDISVQVWCYDTLGLTDVELDAAIGASLIAWLSVQPIGGNRIDSEPLGAIYTHQIVRHAHVVPEIFRIGVTSPEADTHIDIDEVPVPGTISVEIYREASVI